MGRLSAVVVALVLSVPAMSHAQVSIGARVGYAPAMGNAAKAAETGDAVKLSDTLKAQIPFQIDAAYRLTPAVALGAYLSLGVGQFGDDLADACSSGGADCRALDKRVGLQVLYTFAAADPRFVPWVGAGFGYEWATLDLSAGGREASIEFKGWEYLNLQVGGDFAVSPGFSVGPYAMLSVAQYGSAELGANGASISGEIPKKAVHQWLGFGIRGKLDL